VYLVPGSSDLVVGIFKASWTDKELREKSTRGYKLFRIW
jgi:hypothetical protein